MKTERVRLPRKLNKSVVNGQFPEEGRLHPVGALGITLNLQPLHRVSMTLGEKGLPLTMHDLVEVYNQNGSVGIYRVTKITNTYRRQRKIELSHGLDVFADADLPEITKFSGTVTAFLQKVINAQTQTINGVKYWQLGRVDDPHPWNKDIKYDNALECLTELAKTEEDYMFTFDQSSFPWTLNFVARDSTVLSEFRLSRNMESCQVALDDAELCTRLHLSVTTETERSITDDEGVVHVAGITTSQGYYTYDDADAQAVFGIVSKSAGVLQKDVPTPADLEAWVQGYFDRHHAPTLQISISGQELNRLTGESIDELFIGRICRVALPDYATTFKERIVSVSYPDALRTPWAVNVSLANKRQTSEDSFAEIKQTAEKAAGGGGGAAKEEADNNKTEQEFQKIRYNLQVQQDEKRFAIIASESWYEQMEAGGETLIGQYTADFELTARKIGSSLAVTGVQIGEDGFPVVDQETGEYVFNGSGNTLSSQVSQTATAIQQEVTRATEAEGNLGTRITQTDSSIRAVIQADEQTLSELSLTVDGITLSGNTITIKGNSINLTGVVYADELDAVEAEINNLTSGTTTATLLVAEGIVSHGQMSCETLRVGNAIWSSRGMSGLGTGTIAGFLGTNDADLAHSHAISCSESGGTVTITLGAAQASGGSDSFNMADTTWYAGRVSAFKSAVSSALGNAKWNASASTSIYATLDTGNKRLTVNSATASISFPGDTTPTTVNISLGNLDLSTPLTSYYNAGVAEGEGKFALATVTPEGPLHGAIVPIGSRVTVSQLKSGATTHYASRLGTGDTYYLRKTTALNLYHYGRATLYVAPTGGASPAGGGQQDWYYVSTSGTSYYQSDGSVYRYQAGNALTYYATDDIESADYYTAGTVITGLHDAGTPVTDTYYTKRT